MPSRTSIAAAGGIALVTAIAGAVVLLSAMQRDGTLRGQLSDPQGGSCPPGWPQCSSVNVTCFGQGPTGFQGCADFSSQVSCCTENGVSLKMPTCCQGLVCDGADSCVPQGNGGGAVCGNGAVESGEQCDDGNASN